MKRPRWIVPVLLLAQVAASTSARAQEVTTSAADDRPLALTWSLATASRYCFEGFDYSDGQAVVQPQGSATWKAVTAAFWANADPARGEPNEIDLSLQCGTERGRWSADVGWQHLRYPHRGWSATHEVFADLALDAPLAPSLSLHRDVAAGDGAYTTLGLAPSVPFRAATVELAAKLYVQTRYYGMSGVPALETSTGLTLPFGNHTVKPLLQRFWTWGNGDFRGAQALAPGWVVSVAIGSKDE